MLDAYHIYIYDQASWLMPYEIWRKYDKNKELELDDDISELTQGFDEKFKHITKNRSFIPLRRRSFVIPRSSLTPRGPMWEV